MSQPSILILGGYGTVGTYMARYLLQYTSANVIIAGRTISRAETVCTTLAKDFGKERVSVRYADASKKDSLLQAFEGVTLAVIASSTAEYTSNIVLAALKSGIDYFDFQISQKKLDILRQLESQIVNNNRCFITDGGFHPGLVALLVRWAGQQVDILEKANVYSSINLDWNKLVLAPETIQEFIEELSHWRGEFFYKGKWKRLGFLKGNGYQVCNFSKEIGKRACVPMLLEEVKLLPRQYEHLTDVGFFIAGFNPVTDFIAMPLSFLLQRFSSKPSSLAASLLLWSLQKFSRPPFITVLKLEAEGIKNGQKERISLELSHPDGYVMTTLPALVTIQAYLASRKAGFWLQAYYADPQEMIEGLRRYGIAVK